MNILGLYTGANVFNLLEVSLRNTRVLFKKYLNSPRSIKKFRNVAINLHLFVTHMKIEGCWA